MNREHIPSWGVEFLCITACRGSFIVTSYAFGHRPFNINDDHEKWWVVNRWEVWALVGWRNRKGKRDAKWIGRNGFQCIWLIDCYRSCRPAWRQYRGVDRYCDSSPPILNSEFPPTLNSICDMRIVGHKREIHGVALDRYYEAIHEWYFEMRVQIVYGY